LEQEVAEITLSAQRNITKAALDGQEKQREEIGKELHDNVNQVLATANLYLGCALTEDVPDRKLITQSIDSIRYCIEEVRKLSRSLVPPSLGEISLEEAVADLIGRIRFVKGEMVHLDIFGLTEETMSEGLKVSIYRIIQEQLNNIIKYAGASQVTIKIRQTHKYLNILIADDGVGFDVKQKRKGLGLQNIINRAELYNGSVTIDSSPRQGCSLLVFFKLV
jgi:signal transduction histidine kinase